MQGEARDAGADLLADLLADEVRLLVERVAVWTPARWAAAVDGYADHTRADIGHHLAQVLADLAADAEGQPRRPVPRLETDLGVADQVAVTAYDLLTAGPGDQRVRRALAEVVLHRSDLDGTAPPARVAAALGGDAPAVLRAARLACPLSS